MILYILRRLGGLALVVLGMSFVVFVVARTLPGDPARAALGDDAPAATVAAYRGALGLDRPLVVQYVTFLRELARGDLGVSIISRRPVVADLAELLPATIELALLSVLVGIVVGVGLGVASVVVPNRFTVGLARGIPIASLSVPTFWLGLVLQLVLYGKLGWLPAGGQWDPALPPLPLTTGFILVDAALTGDSGHVLRALGHLAMPTFVLAQVSLGAFARITRSSLLDVLGEPWLRTARAKGLSTTRAILRHALPVAAAPIVTVIGLRLGSVMGGAVLTETIFAWPGIGRYAVFSIDRLNMDKAKALLAEAGHPGGGFAIDYYYNTGDEEKRLIGIVFQSQAAKLGIKVNLHVTPWPTLVSKSVAWKDKQQDPPEIGAYGQHISPRYPDGAAFFQFMYHSSAQAGNGRNFMFYSNPEVDRLIDQAVAAPSEKAASTFYERAARIIVDDGPDIFIGKRLEVTVMRKEVQGYYVMPANFRGLRFYELSKP